MNAPEPKVDLRVGGHVWHFEPNRRVYRQPEPGRRYPDGGPIYREHWHLVEITGETARSWVTVYGKCPKKGPHYGFAFSDEEVDDDVFDNENRHRIAALVGHRDGRVPAATLRKIAEIIGYKPE